MSTNPPAISDQPDRLTAGKPSSPKVGTSGKSFSRFGSATASTFIWPE